MTDNEITKCLTQSLRMLDKSIKNLTFLERARSSHGPMESACPFCNFLYQTLIEDIEALHKTREELIIVSAGSDRDKRVGFAASVFALAAETEKRYRQLSGFMEMAHSEVSELLGSKFQEINLDDNPEIKEALKEIIKESMHQTQFVQDFDPSKAN